MGKKDQTEFSPVAFLTEELGISSEHAAEIAKHFEGEPASKLKAAVKRQQEFSRAMDDGRAELERDRAAIAAESERLSQEMAQWASMTGEEKRRATQQQQALEAQQLRALKLQQRLESLATAAGVDPSTIIAEIDKETPTVTIPQTPPQQPPAQSPSGGVEHSHLNMVARMALEFPAELAVITREHKQLTGEDLDPREIVAEITRRANTKGNTKSLDIRQVWEEQHGIPDRREEAREAGIQARIAEAERRGREAALSEANVPGPRTYPGAHPSSPVLAGRTSVLQRPQPLSAQSAAAAALRSGKYRGAEGATPPASS